MRYEVGYAENTEGLGYQEIQDVLKTIIIEYDGDVPLDEDGFADVFTDDCMPILDIVANDVGGNVDWFEFIAKAPEE